MKNVTLFRTYTTAVTVTTLALVLSGAGRASAAVTYRTVALTGDQAPGTNPGVVFDSGLNTFTAPGINGSGQTAFIGFLTGTGVDATNDRGVWSEGSGSLSLLAREGSAAPDTDPGVVYNAFGSSSLALNGSGQAAFVGFLTGTGVDATNNSGIWSQGSGSLSLIAREGNAAPGTDPGVVFSILDTPGINGSGRTAFLGFLTGTGVDLTNFAGIWSEGSGSLSLIARGGGAAPGTGVDIVFNTFSPPVLNGAGQTAFRSVVTGPGVDETSNEGIWSEASGSLSLVAREKDAAPGTGLGVVFAFFASGPTINDAGKVAFLGNLTSFTGGAVTSESSRGIWSKDAAGPLGLVVRTGDAAAGAGPGVVHLSLSSPVLNGAGQLAFSGFLDGFGVDTTNNFGLWSEGGGSLEMVARKGNPAPGTELDVVFGNLGSFALNGPGQIAFHGFLTGPGLDGTNNQGIWATDPDGVVTLIARFGDLFDVNNDPLIDDFKTISALSLFNISGEETGRPSSFNNIGQLTFRLGFTDGSEGIFVATIPEPATLVVFVVGAGLILGKR